MKYFLPLRMELFWKCDLFFIDNFFPNIWTTTITLCREVDKIYSNFDGNCLYFVTWAWENSRFLHHSAAPPECYPLYFVDVFVLVCVLPWGVNLSVGRLYERESAAAPWTDPADCGTDASPRVPQAPPFQNTVNPLQRFEGNDLTLKERAWLQAGWRLMNVVIQGKVCGFLACDVAAVSGQVAEASPGKTWVSKDG